MSGRRITDVEPMEGSLIEVRLDDGTVFTSDCSRHIEESWMHAFLADEGAFSKAYPFLSEVRWPTPAEVEWPPYVELTLDQLRDHAATPGADEGARRLIADIPMTTVLEALRSKRFVARA